MVMLQDPWDLESGRMKSLVVLGVRAVWKWVGVVVLGNWERADWQSVEGARPGSPGKRQVGGLATGARLVPVGLSLGRGLEEDGRVRRRSRADVVRR